MAPTLIALGIHAGELIPSPKPSFPDAAIVAIPTERSASMLSSSGSPAHSDVNLPPPKLRFTEAISNELLRSKT